jgi:hypothetical protein
MSQPRHSAVLTHHFLDVTRLISNSFADVRQMLLAMGLAVLCMADAHAARPMNTDDANIVDEKSCQMEAWVKTTHTSLERWAMPGCNLGGELEWTVGGNAQTEDAIGKTQFWVGQVKKRWVPVGENSVGISTTVGTMATRPASADRANDTDYYFNVPVTVPLGHERFVHINAGWVQHQSLGVSRATWGVGGELPLSPMVIAIAETYGEQNTGRARYQVGLRMWAVPQRVQIDTTYGNQLGQPEHLRWFTVGLRLLSPAFLP